MKYRVVYHIKKHLYQNSQADFGVAWPRWEEVRANSMEHLLHIVKDLENAPYMDEMHIYKEFKK